MTELLWGYYDPLLLDIDKFLEDVFKVKDPGSIIQSFIQLQANDSAISTDFSTVLTGKVCGYLGSGPCRTQPVQSKLDDTLSYKAWAGNKGYIFANASKDEVLWRGCTADKDGPYYDLLNQYVS